MKQSLCYSYNKKACEYISGVMDSFIAVGANDEVYLSLVFPSNVFTVWHSVTTDLV